MAPPLFTRRAVKLRCALVPLLVGVLAASCAMSNHDRRLTLNVLDEHLTPATNTGRWLAAPLALPTGAFGLAADALIVHPIAQIDDAWLDTVDALWQFDAGVDFRTVLLTPLSAVATPVFFSLDWLARSVFDVDDHPSEPSESESEAGR
ncbi:MAG: hypothetical protein AB8H80_03620 [Planctomycetota bacterium]